ncbi:MAG: hypothetical protein JWO56_2332, partial [Acidobacteria bacterium]|nr:hypothetical protein [Acidobacteriota bacterium]
MPPFDRMMSARFDGALSGIILLTIPVFAILSVISSRALYMDGSYYLLNVILANDFFLIEQARTFVHISTQILPLLLLKACVGDLNVLIRAYTIDLCLYPLAVWAVILWRAAKSDEFAVYCTLFAVVYLNGMYFHGESIPTYAFTVLVFSILDSKARMEWPWAVAGTISCFILIWSYEAMLFLGPLLAVRGMLRLIRHPDPGQRAMTIAIVILSVASSASAAYFLIHTRHGHPLAAVTEVSLLWQNRQCVLSAVSGGLFLLVRCGWTRRYASSVAVLGALLAVLLFIPSLWAAPFQTHMVRGFLGLILFGCLGLLLVSPYFSPWLRPTNVGGVIPLILLASLSIAHVYHLEGFRKYHSYVEQLVNIVPGRIADEAIPIEVRSGYSSVWANASQSLLLQCRNGAKGIVDAPLNYWWQPFSPLQPPVLPPQIY